MLKRLKVKSKLIVLLTLVSVIPAFSLFMVYELEAVKLKQTQAEQYGTVASDVLNCIDRNLFERYGDVQAFGYNTSAYDSANWKNPTGTNPLITAMNNYAAAYGFYPIMMLINPEGELLAVNTKTAKGDPIDTASLYHKNYKDEAWFQDAIQGRFLQGTNGLTGTAVGRPQRNALVAEVYKNDGLVIPFSAQVKNTNGELVGVWVNFADFSLVENIVGSLRAKMIEHGMEDPDLMVFDREGTQLVDYDPDTLGKDGNLTHDFDKIILKKNFISLGVQAAKLAAKGQQGYAPM